MKKNCSQNDGPSVLSTVRLLCPSCFRRYEFPEVKVKEQPPLCPYCGVPLVRNRLNGETLRTVSPDSPWSKKIRDQIDAEMARTCQDFVRVQKTKQQRRNPKGNKHS